MSRSGSKIGCNQKVELDNALVEKDAIGGLPLGTYQRMYFVSVGVGVVMVRDTPAICHLCNFTSGEKGR